MKKRIFLAFVLALLNFSTTRPDLTFSQINRSNWLFEKTKVICHNNDSEAGEIWYAKIPFLSTYILYNFYVHPSQRKQGIGNALLEYVCNCLQKKASIIFIQPGPFEKENVLEKALSSETVRQERVEQLVSLYTRVGFKPAHWSLIYCCRALYYIIGLREDANYLMCK